MTLSSVRPAGLFITGTDTGVGKTTVAAGLARLARRRGRAVIPFKPVETGCAPEPLDAAQLLRASQATVALTDVCPFPLALAAAPAAAAEAIGLRLDLDHLVTCAFKLAARGDFLLTEGAGGLLAPYASKVTNADLAARLGLPIVVVARAALGTINHIGLTVRELRRRDLPIAGLLVVRGSSASEPHEDWNARLIEDVAGLAPTATLPWLPGEARSDPEALADWLQSAIPDFVLTRWL